METQEIIKLISQTDSTELQMMLKGISVENMKLYDLEKLSTQIREYSAVSTLQYSELSDYIMRPELINNQPSMLLNPSELSPFLTSISFFFNEAQNTALAQIS